MTGTKRGPVVGTVARRSRGAAMAITVAAVTSVTTGCSRPTFESEHSSAAETTASIAPLAAAAPLASTPRAGFVRLARSAHPMARPELEIGRVEPGRRLSNLSLFFKLTPDQRRERDALAAAQLESELAPLSPVVDARDVPPTIRREARGRGAGHELARRDRASRFIAPRPWARA